MLELCGVSKRFGRTVAVRDVDLEVTAGSTCVVLGPSGCGKSTVLRLIAGLVRPDSGTVALEGSVLDTGNILAARRRMGYVIQEGGLFPHMTCRRNVSVMADYLRTERSRVAGRIARLSDLVGLSESLLDRFPGELSGGQRQRVSLMRALMLDPDLLLLDEPLGALDPMIRFQLQKDLKSIFSRLGKTVVMVTHDVAEAAWFADTVVMMQAGRVVQVGPIEELIRSPADEFVRQFFDAQRVPLERLSELMR